MEELQSDRQRARAIARTVDAMTDEIPAEPPDTPFGFVRWVRARDRTPMTGFAPACEVVGKFGEMEEACMIVMGSGRTYYRTRERAWYVGGGEKREWSGGDWR